MHFKKSVNFPFKKKKKKDYSTETRCLPRMDPFPLLLSCTVCHEQPMLFLDCVNTLENYVLDQRSHRGVHRIAYLAVKTGIILVNDYFLKIFFANYCHL